MTPRLTVAFAQIGAGNWHGGQRLVANAVRALRAVAADRVRVLTLGSPAPESIEYARAAGADGLVAYQAPAWWAPQRSVGALMIRVHRHNQTLEATLKRAGVQVLIEESVAWRLGSVATIGWLPDFQHLRLPELFDAAERARRDSRFRDTMRLADRVLATASVANDAREFAPEYAHKLRVVSPFAIIDPAIYARDPGAVTAKHGLPRKFLYVPNQFWVHKNHALLFKALHLLHQQGVQPHVVLTGRVEDYRDPGHFPRLMRQVTAWNIGPQVHYLGVVERNEVYDLMRQAICVVNPSLFEGWGYGVDEAAAVGKRILASDLPTHREQEPPACEFFDPANAEGLAEKLEHVWDSAEPGPSSGLEADARLRMPVRARTLGETLFSVLQEVAPMREGVEA